MGQDFVATKMPLQLPLPLLLPAGLAFLAEVPVSVDQQKSAVPHGLYR